MKKQLLVKTVPGKTLGFQSLSKMFCIVAIAAAVALSPKSTGPLAPPAIQAQTAGDCGCTRQWVNPQEGLRCKVTSKLKIAVSCWKRLKSIVSLLFSRSHGFQNWCHFFQEVTTWFWEKWRLIWTVLVTFCMRLLARSAVKVRILIIPLDNSHYWCHFPPLGKSFGDQCQKQKR